MNTNDLHYTPNSVARRMMRIIGLVAICAGCLVPCLLGAETLPPLEDGIAPQSVEALWANVDPLAEPLDTEILKQWEEDGVILKVLRYRVGIFKGRKAMMAAIFGYPKGAKNVPGLVQAHGGGQYADYRAVLANAKRGYATISIAWAGRINAPGYKVSPDVVKLFFEQEIDHKDYKLTTDWGALDAYHAPSRDGIGSMNVDPAPYTIDAVESPRNCCYFLWTLGARRALTFLEQQPEVDADRLGIYGHSMGGKITVLTAGIDRRVKAAAPSCGGISNDTTNELYQKTLADALYLDRMRCPIIFLSPSNDFHGHLIDIPKAAHLIDTDQWRVVTSAHGNHQDIGEFEVGGLLWFDQHLKGSFTYPAAPEVELNLNTPNGLPEFTLTADRSHAIAAVDVYYTQDVEDLSRERRKYRYWHFAQPISNGKHWRAELPLSSTEKPLWAYANVRYRLDSPVSGAGYYYRVYTTDVFNVSSAVQTASPAELVEAKVKATLTPSLTIEDFKGDWEKEWFVYRQDTWEDQDSWERITHKVNSNLWRARPNAALAIDVRSERPQSMIVSLDGNVAELSLSGEGQWQTFKLQPGDFTRGNRGEALPADWQGIRELKLAPKRRGDPRPEFRNLRWEVDAKQ